MSPLTLKGKKKKKGMKKTDAKILIHRPLPPVHMGHKAGFRQALSVDFSQIERKVKTRSGRRVAHSRSCITACPSACIVWHISLGPPEAQAGISNTITDSVGHPWQRSKCSTFECLSLLLTKRHSNDQRVAQFHSLFAEPAYLEREG